MYRIKATVLRPVFRNTESADFLLEKDEPFSLDRQYLLNEESSLVWTSKLDHDSPCLVHFDCGVD